MRRGRTTAAGASPSSMFYYLPTPETGVRYHAHTHIELDPAHWLDYIPTGAPRETEFGVKTHERRKANGHYQGTRAH